MRKHCPKCKGPLVSLRSISVKKCADCGREYDNKLKPTQEPLIKAQR